MGWTAVHDAVRRRSEAWRAAGGRQSASDQAERVEFIASCAELMYNKDVYMKWSLLHASYACREAGTVYQAEMPGQSRRCTKWDRRPVSNYHNPSRDDVAASLKPGQQTAICMISPAPHDF